MPKVAILFFGLTRNLRTTIESIDRHVFRPLRENGIDYDIFIHTYKIHGEYHNQWAHEHTSEYPNEDVESILHPRHALYDNQDDVIQSIDFNEYYTKLGNWTGMTQEMTKFLIRNMCLALYSKQRITRLFEEHQHEYDYAMILRPDLYLQNDIEAKWFDEIRDDNIVIPEKDWFWGCNDRCCIGRPRVVAMYGKLFDELKEYSRQKSIVSEVYLMDKLKEKNIHILAKPIAYNMLRIPPT